MRLKNFSSVAFPQLNLYNLIVFLMFSDFMKKDISQAHTIIVTRYKKTTKVLFLKMLLSNFRTQLVSLLCRGNFHFIMLPIIGEKF